MGALARKLWSAEHLTRENKWGFWHPYLPFLGDEVTGKTVAIIGTGRIGLAMIKKCAGFDMNILCYDPAYQNHEYIKGIQETNDLRHARGISREKTWIKYVPLDEALAGADFVSVHVPLLRETWVLAARGRVETTLNDNALIPYFMMPSLGSGSDLRAYSSDRFRDRRSSAIDPYRSAVFLQIRYSRRLFDHLVGAKQQVVHSQPERLRGLEIDDELELGRLFDRNVSGLLSL